MPTHHRLSLLLSANLLWLTISHAQYNQAETFTIQDGLAHTECTNIYRDKAGMIWVHHYQGMISRFDGHAFETYWPDEIGVFSVGGKFAEDHRGLWVAGQHSLSLFQAGKWKTFKVRNTQDVQVDKSSNQIIALNEAGELLKFDAAGDTFKVYASLPSKMEDENHLIVQHRFKTECLILVLKYDALGLVSKLIKAYKTNSLLDPTWGPLPENYKPSLEWQFDQLTGAGLDIIESHFPENPYQLRREKLLSNGTNLLYIQSCTNPFGPGMYHVLYKVDEQQNFHLLAKHVNDYENISVVADKVNHLWVTSHSGLTRIYPNIIECFENHPNMVSALHAINEDDKGRIWFGGHTSGICYFENDQIHKAPLESEKFRDFMPGSYRDDDGNMAFWTSGHGIIHFENGKWSQVNLKHPYGPYAPGFYFLKLRDQRLALGTSGMGIGITSLPLKPDSKIDLYHREKGINLLNILTIAEDKRGRLWLGRSSEGIAVYDPSVDTAQTWLLNVDSVFNYGMMSSAVDHKGRLWMGCSDGLRVIESPEKFQLFKDDINEKATKISIGEAGNSQVGLLKVYKHFLVFGNSLGYGFLDLNTYAVNGPPSRIYFFPTSKFGLACEQNAVLIDSKGYLWLGQDKGAIRIDVQNNFLDSMAIQLIPQYIIARGQDRDSTILQFDGSGKLRLPFNKRNISFHIAPQFSPSLYDNVYIQYSLIDRDNKDTLWSPLSKNYTIRLDLLPPGHQKILVRGVKNNQVADQKEISLFVPPRLHERPSFWISLFTVFSISGFLITRNVYRQRLQLRLTQINLAEQQREKNQFQISAIANALNPHFIKNTLAWMQSRFRKDEQVVDVIDRLAFNIGSVFSHSRKGEAFHTLEEELKVLENFLSIQLAIYGPFLHITIPEEEKWKPWKHVLVPLLQIQIHVENAIEHGLRNKPKGDKKLDVDIRELDEHYIQVSVTDNGIGRVAAKERGSRGTKQGTMMLDRVYELYNQHNHYNFQTTFEDLYDENGEAAGTSVLIRIPKQYKLELA